MLSNYDLYVINENRARLYRESGVGGVGVVSYGVTLVHLPTGLAVHCSNYKSTLQNFETAKQQLSRIIENG